MRSSTPEFSSGASAPASVMVTIAAPASKRMPSGTFTTKYSSSPIWSAVVKATVPAMRLALPESSVAVFGVVWSVGPASLSVSLLAGSS